MTLEAVKGLDNGGYRWTKEGEAFALYGPDDDDKFVIWLTAIDVRELDLDGAEGRLQVKDDDVTVVVADAQEPLDAPAGDGAGYAEGEGYAEGAAEEGDEDLPGILGEDEPDHPDAAGIAVRGFAERNELDTLFEYLAGKDMTAVMKSVARVRGAGAALEKVATDFPDVFYAWFSACEDENVKRALAARPAIADVFAAQIDAIDMADGEGEGAAPDQLDEHEEDPYLLGNDAKANAEMGTRSLFLFLRMAQDTEAVMESVRRVDGAGAALDKCARDEPAIFTDLLEKSTPEVQVALKSRPAIATAIRDERARLAWAAGSGRRTKEDITLQDADRTAIADTNSAALKSLANGGQTTWLLGGRVVLIGNAHATRHTDYVAEQNDQARGTVKVQRARLRAGDLIFIGCPPAKEQAILTAAPSFSDKTVRFERTPQQIPSR